MIEPALAVRAQRREVEWELVDWERLRGGRVRARLSVLRSVRDQGVRSGSLTPAPLPEGEGSCFGVCESTGGDALSLGERVGVRVRDGRVTLVRALLGESATRVGEAARNLAGLGEGSTPAGDDFLVGAMYALRWLLPDARASRLCESIAAAAAPRTTRLSAQWLHRAAGGEAIPTWSFFLSALAAGEPARMRASARGVLALGHTSGRAALDGFIATAEALIGDPA